VKQIFIDVETTGLDPKENCVWQIAFIIEQDGAELCRHNLKTAPIPGSNYNVDAMKKGNITPDEIRSFPDSYKTLRNIKEIFSDYIDPFKKPKNQTDDKMFFIAYNAEFDMKFLRSFFERQGDKYLGSWFWFPYIDVMTLTMQEIKYKRHLMPNFQQDTVAKALGIDVDESRLHDAMYDVELCKRVYETVTLRPE